MIDTSRNRQIIRNMQSHQPNRQPNRGWRARRATAALRGLRTAGLALALVAVLWSLLAARPLLAQSTSPAAGTPVSANDINDVARQLWCPLCSGVRLDACELKACAQMKDEIGIMLAQGTEVQEIKDIFVDRYGPQVLGEPPRSGFNWLAWALPFIVLAGGGVYLYTRARAMGRTPNAAATISAAAPAGEYDRKLDAELKQYD